MTSTPRAVDRGALRACVLALFSLHLDACSNPHFRSPLEGRVVDADTRAPIQGAVVLLETYAHCAKFMSGETRNLPTEQARTAQDGRFRIGRYMSFAPNCFANGWGDELYVMAPGYSAEHLSHSTLPALDTHEFASPGLDLIELHRICYLGELEAFRRDVATHEAIRRYMTSPGSQFRDTSNKILSGSVRVLDTPGVFVRDPESTFDQITTTRVEPSRLPQLHKLVLAHDRRTGRVKAWTTRGEPVPVPLLAEPGWSIAGKQSFLDDRSYSLFLVRGEAIYYPARQDATPHWLDPDNWLRVPGQIGSVRAAAALLNQDVLITVEGDGTKFGLYQHEKRPKPSAKSYAISNSVRPLRTVPVDEVLPGAKPPVECMTEATDGSVLFFANTASGRTAYRLQAFTSWKAAPFAIPSAMLSGEVTACVATHDWVYFAIRGEGIRRVSADPLVMHLQAVWHNATTEARVPGTFTGLAISEFRSLWRTPHVLIYAVADDGIVYRFLEDGTPDQHVEVEPFANGTQ